ncbi:MAG: nucleoside hydrolase [Clostridia bacterium]|nr:nucleoside hydrolase [Clostridia bacterium]
MNEALLRKLEVPTGIVDAVIDSDTFNEIDDQFAITYMLKSDERINVCALYAAPFFNENSTGPEDGMEKSYNEMITLLTLTGRDDLKKSTFKGSRSYMPDENTFVPSEAASDLARRAMNYTSEKPLYVVSIGAITNVASAIVMNPEIIDRIVIVWLGGHALEWPDTAEFNMRQDVAAARIIFGCGAALVQLPCAGVVDHFTISEPELNYWIKGKSPICDHLADATIRAANSYAEGKPWTRVIWDVTAVAFLTNDNNRFMDSRLIPSPIPQYDDHYSFDPRRHPIRYVWNIHRDRLMEDLIYKLTK